MPVYGEEIILDKPIKLVEDLPLTYKGKLESELIAEKKLIPDALIKLCRHNLRIRNGLEEEGNV